MTYDLRRPRLHGLVQRISHTNTYVLTPEGQRAAAFYTKLDRRLLRPLLDADKPPAPAELRRALAVIDKDINDCVNNNRTPGHSCLELVTMS
jgi:predicted MarR family transcription regulator